VHTETAISRHTTSVSHVAIQLMQQQTANLSAARVLLIGAGETAELAAKALKMHHVQQLTCINRTLARAEELVARTLGRALPWNVLPAALAEADVVLCTTSSPRPVLSYDEVSNALTQRRDQPLVIVDLAVPRDVETSVAELPGVALYDIDQLQSVLDMNLHQREAAIPQVEAIIQDEQATFLTWLHSRQAVPVLTGFRQKVSALAEAEVKQALQRMDGLNKMLHEPTERLKAHAASGEGRVYLQAIQDLFALDISSAETEQVDCPCSNL
jgi:glutamyl-tRNA reductase